MQTERKSDRKITPTLTGCKATAAYTQQTQQAGQKKNVTCAQRSKIEKVQV